MCYENSQTSPIDGYYMMEIVFSGAIVSCRSASVLATSGRMSLCPVDICQSLKC